jgi:hypothetical protein
MANSLNPNNNTNSYIGTQSKIKNIPSIHEIDMVNVYEFENGMDVELTKLGGELTSENIRKSQSKVLKNLKKDPAFYTNKIAKETIERFGEYGSGKKKKSRYQTKKDAEGVKADRSKEVNKEPGGYVDLAVLNEAIETEKDIKTTMKKQVSQPIKTWDQIVADMATDGKVKLTKENMAIISEEVAKMVKEAKAYAVTTSSGRTTTRSFKDQADANRFKNDNTNITGVEEL